MNTKLLITLILIIASLFVGCRGPVKVGNKINAAAGSVAPGQVSFSGEWKSKESISMGGNIVCVYGEGDRMLSKTMKIAEQADFLSIEVPNPSPGAPLATSQEKLAFDGKESESQINHGREWGKMFRVKLSADGQTMTVNSIVHFMTATPSNINVQKQAFFYVTEVWKLSNDGKSISVQANAKSNLFGEERSWKTVFDKQLATDYRY